MRRLTLISTLLLLALAAYGFIHERLWAQTMWTSEGRARFLIYTAVYWATAALFLILAPRWLPVAAAVFALAFTFWWSGPLAPFAVIYLFGSCLFFGRWLRRDSDPATAILLGLAAWMFVLWIALHFRVNTPRTYALAFAIPYAAARSRLRAATANEPCRGNRGLAVLLYFLLAYWLIALKPEVSADGVSMHLALPMAVAHDHRWAFDFPQYTWALMPAAGDGFFTAAYLLGGETAARLANFALLALMAGMIAQVSRRWLSAALFVSTPLAVLVTGSLFVENIWAALILGAALAVVRYDEDSKAAELYTAAALFGAALAVKLIAAMFVAPAAVILGWIAIRRRQAAALAPAALLLALTAAPPYLYSFIKSGNPVFPFANNIFRSPYFEAQPFVDPRFAAPLSWRTLYDATFRSALYIEGQGGSAGFQYFLLLLPALLLVRKRSSRILAAIGVVASLAIFAALHNLRYTYAALPLFSILIGGLLAEPFAPFAFAALAALNAGFLASSGWYQNDFVFFRKSQEAAYLKSAAPERVLIDRLNREAPGEPVAFFGTDAIAGLHAPAFTASWHSNEYWQRLRGARTGADVAATLRSLGIRHVLAPASRQDQLPLFETFLREWLDPDGPARGRVALFRLRDAALVLPRELPALPAGAYDDLDGRIEFTGAWIHDRQFSEPANGSVTYCDVPGASLRFAFTGSELTYVFTKALNRGVALVLLDGAEQARIDQYARRTQWRASRTFGGLAPGRHGLEIRVTGERDPSSAGAFVDLDQLIVR